MVTSTLHLRERRARHCRLAPDEVAFLLGQHRTHFHLTPTAQRHVWEVTPAGIAGIVITPRRRIVVSPKIPLRNLLFLGDSEREPDLVTATPEASVIDVLAERLAGLMRERAEAGLHRDYRDRAHEGPYLVGQLDVAAQLRQPVGRKDLLHSRHNDFTMDLAWNQVPRTLAAMLTRSPLLTLQSRVALTAALTGWTSITEVSLTPVDLAELRSPRLPTSYRPLAALCLLLADALAPTPAAGATPAVALLISLERWFEQYVTKTIVDTLTESQTDVAIQRTYVIGEPDVRVRPDVTLTSSGVPRVIVDAKWKRLDAGGPDSADTYQVLSYALLLGAECAMLVYPGRGPRRELTFAKTPLRVLLRTLNVAGSWDNCRLSRERLGLELRQLSESTVSDRLRGLGHSPPPQP